MSSAELSKTRKQLSEVKSLVRQGRVFPAVQHVHTALNIIMRTPLIKNERTELEDLIQNAVAWIADSAKIREKFPLAIVYTPGQEDSLFDIVQQLLDVLQVEVQEQATESLRLLEERRAKMLTEAESLLSAGDVDKAAALHDQITREFGEDQEILSAIGEQYLNSGRYEDAFEYLSKALAANPDAIHLYNRVGIALRKLERYETAEKYYKKALEMAGKDVGLLFNLGRLYVEWKHWLKAEKAARLIVKIAPDFSEGNKLLAYIIKQQQIQAQEQRAAELLENQLGDGAGVSADESPASGQ